MSDWISEHEKRKELDLKYVRAKRREKGATKTFSTEQESEEFIKNNPDSVAVSWASCAMSSSVGIIRAKDSLFLSPTSGKLTRARSYFLVKRSKDLPIDPCKCNDGKPYEGHIWMKDKRDNSPECGYERKR